MSTDPDRDVVTVPARLRGLDRVTVALGYIALAGVLLALGANRAFIDPDLWHEMGLVREVLRLGHFPRRDPFSYTSTVTPLVHHEWGTGAVQYALFSALGPFGLTLLRDVLVIGIGVGCYLCARRRGAGPAILWASFPVAALLVRIGLTTVRAQMFTLFLLAVLLWFLELDRAGRRWWIAPWLVLFVLWVNLHAGFVVGVVAFVLYVMGRLLRRRPVRHLVAVGVAMAALTAVNPWGIQYYHYLWYGLRLDRSWITEWYPIWRMTWPYLVVYGLSLLMVVYGLVRAGLREATGMLFLFAAAWAAALHQRHLSIYAVAWTCYVPALLQRTPLGTMFSRALAPGRRGVRVAVVVASVIGLAAFAERGLEAPILPANPGDHPHLFYPVGPVGYMDDTGFEGNLVVPFEVGAFVTWELYPRVLVSLDGRFEVAYAPGLADRQRAFYQAEDGWEEFLDDPHADAVLARGDMPVAGLLGDLPGWRWVYRDDVYQLFVRGGSDLPVVDRRGERLSTSYSRPARTEVDRFRGLGPEP